jgi:hypothetical protein
LKSRLHRLRGRAVLAQKWAVLAKDADSWVAAATLLRTAEELDSKLAELEGAAEAELRRVRTSDEVAQRISDIAAALGPAELQALQLRLARPAGETH